MCLRKSELDFLAKFLFLFSIPFALLNAIPLEWLEENLATGIGGILSTAGVRNFVAGSRLFLPNIVVRIVPECLGFVMPIALLALLYSTPVNRKNRIASGLFGAIVFPLTNVLRLIAVSYAGAVYGTVASETLHILSWFLDAGIVFMLWKKSFGKKIL
jgi:exosortase/archaeosortase family protein